MLPAGDHVVPIGKARAGAGRAGPVDHHVRARPSGRRSRPRSNWSARTGSSVEVIDLRTLLPMDDEAIVATVRKTNRVLIVHEDTRTGGIAGEITARINELASNGSTRRSCA